MALRTAAAHASRGDVTVTAASLGQAVIVEAQARLAERRRWTLNEKGLVAGTGLEAAHGVLARTETSPGHLTVSVQEVGDLLGFARSRG